MKKQITKKHPEGFIRIKISTDGCGGSPYFSITADLCADSTFHDSKIHACGCLHDEILALRPDLRPFVDLHLSTLDGVPIYAVENGFYWLCKAADIPQKYEPEQDAEKCFAYLCDHLRIQSSEAKFIIEKAQVAYELGKQKIAVSDEVTAKCRKMQHEQGIFDAKNYFKEVVDSMKFRWQNEAERAIKQLEKIP